MEACLGLSQLDPPYFPYRNLLSPRNARGALSIDFVAFRMRGLVIFNDRNKAVR